MERRQWKLEFPRSDPPDKKLVLAAAAVNLENRHDATDQFVTWPPSTMRAQIFVVLIISLAACLAHNEHDQGKNLAMLSFTIQSNCNLQQHKSIMSSNKLMTILNETTGKRLYANAAIICCNTQEIPGTLRGHLISEKSVFDSVLLILSGPSVAASGFNAR